MNHSIMNNVITEIKSTLEGSNCIITEAEDRTSKREDRMVEINEAKRKKKNNRIKINEIKNTLGGTKSRIMEGEDRISEVEDRMVEVNEAERKKEKRIKRNEDNLRDLWENVKCPNI